MTAREFARHVSTNSYSEPSSPAAEQTEQAVGSSPESEPEQHETETPETTEEQSTEPENWDWATPFKDLQQIHDMSSLEILQALQQGQIPEALLDKLILTGKDGEEEWSMSVAEARDGNMMRRNFTRKTQELARERNAFSAERDELVNYLHSWQSDPMKLLAGAHKMKFPIMEAAKILAQREAEIQGYEALEAEGRLPPGSAERRRAEFDREIEHESMRLQLQRQEQRQSQEQFQAQHQARVQQTAQACRSAFDAAGLKGEGMWNVFKSELGAMWTPEEQQKRPASPQEIRTAILATKEQYQQFLAGRKQEQAKQPAGAPKLQASRPLDAGGGKRVAPRPAQHTQPMTTKDFKRQFFPKFGG